MPASRQPEIEKQEVGAHPARELGRCEAVAGLVDFMADALQPGGDDRHGIGVVVHE